MFAQKGRYVVGILVLVLIISVGVNLYDHFVTLPKIQATMNNMRTEALLQWLNKIGRIRYLLEHSETNFDVWEAEYDAYLAGDFVDIYGVGIGYDPETIKYTYNPETLGYWLRRSTWGLGYAVEAIYLGNQTGVITSRNLDQYILQKIENITQTIESIENYMVISANGVDPVKQLQEKGNLTKIMNYCKQIHETYIEIVTYY